MTMTKHHRALELDKVLEMLAEETGCERSRQLALELVPSGDYDQVVERMAQTADANSLAIQFGTPGVRGLTDCAGLLDRAQVGSMLMPAELLVIGRNLRIIRSLKEWKRQSADQATTLDDLFDRLIPNQWVEERIAATVLSEEEIADTASPALADIRRQIRQASLRIREQLDKIVRSSATSKYLQEQIVTQRDGRFVVPVKAEYKNEIKGLVHDTSASGATFFIEPMAVVEANNEIRLLEGKERQEVERILQEITQMIGDFAPSLRDGMEAAAQIDFQFAKSRLATRMRAMVPQITRDHAVHLNRARHPLIPREKIVPVDIMVGESFDTLVITGPNTGGKTVALKTLGLMTLMAMCGLMIPAGDGSRVSVFRHVLADIGDEQSIEQSLSTFSAHMANTISILRQADGDALVLMDELGAGTDPVEGAALAVAIIQHLREAGARVAATTHYAEIKMYALETDGVENGSCEFDVETLSPTYRLLIGVPGRSNAFAISRRLGLPEEIIHHAQELVSTENTRFEDVVNRLETARQELEKEKAAAQQARREAEDLRRQAQDEAKKAREEQEKLLLRAQDQARSIVEQTRAQSDLLLNELEELRRQKDKADFSQRAREASSRQRGRLDKMRDAADPVIRRQEEGYTLPRPLKAGDLVVIADINTEGTVLSGPDQNDCYLVQAGIMKTKVPAKGLRLADDHGRKTTVNSRSVRQVTSKSQRQVKTELDIRGKASDEGILELDRFLDNALMTGVKTVTIIHGKGTGVLRKAIRDRLHRLKCVKSFRPGVYGEGEDGVTVVELK